MKIGLIAMSGVRVRTPELAQLGVTLPGFIRRGKTIASLPSLGLLTVAALTPTRHEVSYLEVDEQDDESSLPQFDLVGVSSLSARIDDAYKIADRYRRRGTQVVVGGLHVSSLPDEALEHADAVVLNGAEDVWPDVVRDAEQGRLQKRYRGTRQNLFPKDRHVMPRFDLLAGRHYNRLTIQTSRGCPRRCDFCGASLLITNGYEQKPVAQVMAEIRAARSFIKEPFFEFADDNTFLNRKWSREFLSALAREDVRWFTETDVSIAEDTALCDLLAESGCRQVLIGFESPAFADLDGIDPANWKARHAPHYRRVIDTLQSRGISVNGCFILGLDTHTPDVFPQLLEFVRGSGLAEVQFTVLTPFPGTPLRARLEREGRLLHERSWDRCTLFDVNFVPKRMKLEELESGLRWLFQEAYSHEATRHRQEAFVNRRRTSPLT